MTAARALPTRLGAEPSDDVLRLVQEAELLRAESEKLLDRAGLLPGGRAIDLGCGPVGILEPLAQRAGPAGTVIGLDHDPGYLHLAREWCSHRGCRQVRLVRANALSTGLAENSFDLVHARLVLGHVRHPQRLVQEAARICRPGGVIAVQEADWSSWRCEPAHPAWETLLSILRAHLQQQGRTPDAGRALPRFLRESQLREIEVSERCYELPLGERKRMDLLERVQRRREGILAARLAPARRLDRLEAALQDHLLDPETRVFSPAFILAWGRK